MKLALLAAAVYCAPMRLYSGARTARLLCWSAALTRASWWVGLSCGLVWLCVAPLVHAQAGASQPDSADVLQAPPPAPELTEQDDRAPAAPPAPPAPAPVSQPKARPASAKKPAPPAAAAAAPAPTKARKAELVAPALKLAQVAPSPAVPQEPQEPQEPQVPQVPQGAGSPPPRPPVDGDFAGTAAAGALPVNAPQEDFEAEAQEISHTHKREYSVRVDLLNWLLLGRLSFELEMGLWKFLSVQLTPVFVTAHSPIAINYAGLDEPLKQYSHGIGPISGVSLAVGAWLWGEPFKGYVLRLEITNYAYSYRSADAAGQIDRVDFTERRAVLFVGSHSRFGAFTFAGGFGLGYELHHVDRCGLSAASGAIAARVIDCKGKQQIALDRIIEERANLNGPLHPFYFQARFSVGVVF